MSPDAGERAARNAALRLAFAITVGLVMEALRGAALPILAPVIALQLLAGFPRPPGMKVLAMMVLVTALASAAAYLVSVLTVNNPGLYAIGVGLLYLWSFFLTFTPRTQPIGILATVMTVVITGISTASTGVALGLMASLIQSVALGFVIVYLAHAVLPTPDAMAAAAPADAPGQTPELPPATRALLATIVILPLHLYLFAQGVGSILVLMTTITILRLPGLAQSARYVLSFALGNLAGGLAAALAMLVVGIQTNILVMLSVTAALSLLLAWQSARGPVWRAAMVPGMVAFTILFGIIYSPYLDTKDVSVTARVIMVVMGSVYSFAAISLLYPVLQRHWKAPRPGAGASAP